MFQRITEFFKSFKGLPLTDLLLALLLIIIGFGSFALGRFSALSTEKSEVRICTVEESILMKQDPERTLPQKSTAAPPVSQKTGEASAQTAAAATPAASIEEGAYVASKSGKAYHLPWCPGAQRIKAENKIWFDTKEQAEAVGYQPAGNCKGL